MKENGKRRRKRMRKKKGGAGQEKKRQRGEGKEKLRERCGGGDDGTASTYINAHKYSSRVMLKNLEIQKGHFKI